MVIDCSKCDGHCCKSVEIPLTESEYNAVREAFPDQEIVTMGSIHAMKPPCPYFSTDDGEGPKCLNYEHRFDCCRVFPLGLQPDYTGGDAMLITVRILCPQAIGITKQELTDLFATYLDQLAFMTPLTSEEIELYQAHEREMIDATEGEERIKRTGFMTVSKIERKNLQEALIAIRGQRPVE
jgi:Fe-S-cluster containining protein